MSAATHPNYPVEGSHYGQGPGGWWRLARDLYGDCPTLMRGEAQYIVSVGAVRTHPHDELWIHNYRAAVDDFGTLRRIKE